GGGLIRTDGDSPVTISSSIVSGNVSANAPDISLKGSKTDIAINASAIGNTAGINVIGGGNLPNGTNLKLGPLANNGGPTQTLMPALDSPLLNMGTNTGGLSYDQRGMARVLDGAADIGA